MLTVAVTQALLALACGSLVGLSLALVGGGGSMLAVPLLLYIVGVHDPHVAIGTSALAVALNAFANVIPHARAGRVRWKAAGMFAVTGMLGAYAGSSLGKAVAGHRLVLAFAVLMLVVAGLMLRGGQRSGEDRYPTPHAMPKLAATGLGAGVLAGFFGIGGGFLVVPGLMLASGMAIINAIGTSLIAVGSFGMTAAANYALSGWIDWTIAAQFIAGGVVGGWIGAHLAGHLANRKGALNTLFALMIIAVAISMLWHGL